MEFVFVCQGGWIDTVDFESFELDYWNLIKIRIPHEGKKDEPAWVYISSGNKKRYDDKLKSWIIPCVLRNGSRNFPLGAYIPLMLDGTARPAAITKGWIGGCYCYKDEEKRILEQIYNRGVRDMMEEAFGRQLSRVTKKQ